MKNEFECNWDKDKQMGLILRRASESDLIVLAQMNKQLIVDEGNPNPMTIQELEERMRGWFFSDWNIDLICCAAQVIGYALYQYRENQYYKEQEEVYLRQYFIKPDFRNKGFGQAGINLLLENRYTSEQTIVIDVLECNPKGMNFWEKVGFIPYSTTMTIKKRWF
jgi:GNAT superfamily N-acetyltransferase